MSEKKRRKTNQSLVEGIVALLTISPCISYFIDIELDLSNQDVPIIEISANNETEEEIGINLFPIRHD